MTKCLSCGDEMDRDFRAGFCIDCDDVERASLDSLQHRIRAWADDVGLPYGDPAPQAGKVLEEAQELVDQVEQIQQMDQPDRHDLYELLDEGGDVFVTLVCFFRTLGYRIEEGAEATVEKIEQRAADGGRIVDGQYVKPEDLPEVDS